MIAELLIQDTKWRVDLSKPIDLSIPVAGAPASVTAWYVKPPEFNPVQMGDWTGRVAKGAGVNFNNVFFNPHGHGTHTECFGHISLEEQSVNRLFKDFFSLALLHTVSPVSVADPVIGIEALNGIQWEDACTSLIIRTLPNGDWKKTRHYSGTDPAYLSCAFVSEILHRGIRNLLIDTPSVDREKDGGKLSAHHLFWNYPEHPAAERSITELIYAGNEVQDGKYLLNLQVAAFENDAAPSRPLLFSLI